MEINIQKDFFIDKAISQCYDIENKIEVAYIISTLLDVTAAGEGGEKGYTPKEPVCWKPCSWAYSE